MEAIKDVLVKCGWSHYEGDVWINDGMKMSFQFAVVYEVEKAAALRARLAELVCPECGSRVMDNGYCMMGHWCGKPLK
jgi:hypothetical protein